MNLSQETPANGTEQALNSQFYELADEQRATCKDMQAAKYAAIETEMVIRRRLDAVRIAILGTQSWRTV